MRTGALASLVSLMIWVVVGGAVMWAQPTPPASLFGRTSTVVTVAAVAPDVAVDARCGDDC